MKKNNEIIIGGLLLVIFLSVAFYAIKVGKDKEGQEGDQAAISINSFEECVEAGYAVSETYPRKCTVEGGETFLELVSTEEEKMDYVQVATLTSGGYVSSSPLIIEGQARGTWFFEGSFPIRLYDENGNILGEAIAIASEEWMTTEFVEYEATLEFDVPASGKGLLVFQKDNPSDIREMDDSMQITLNFGERK